MYYCESCEQSFRRFRTPGQCPNCGVFANVRCRHCGYVDSAAKFAELGHKCPDCGATVAIPGGDDEEQPREEPREAAADARPVDRDALDEWEFEEGWRGFRPSIASGILAVLVVAGAGAGIWYVTGMMVGADEDAQAEVSESQQPENQVLGSGLSDPEVIARAMEYAEEKRKEREARRAEEERNRPPVPAALIKGRRYVIAQPTEMYWYGAQNQEFDLTIPAGSVIQYTGTYEDAAEVKWATVIYWYPNGTAVQGYIRMEYLKNQQLRYY